MTENTPNTFPNGHTVLKQCRHGYVHSGDLVVDIGANIGTHTALANLVPGLCMNNAAGPAALERIRSRVAAS